MSYCVDLQTGSQVVSLFAVFAVHGFSGGSVAAGRSHTNNAMLCQGVCATPETEMFLGILGSERNCVASTANSFFGLHHHDIAAEVATVQNKMCMQRLAMLQGCFQGQRFSSTDSSLEDGLGHGNKKGSECIGREKFLCCGSSRHFSSAFGFLSCRPSWSAL